jgi:hypothetical protein
MLCTDGRRSGVTRKMTDMITPTSVAADIKNVFEWGEYLRERPDRVFVGGYYSKIFRSTLNRLALDEDTTTQALIGEAVDLLMRSRGKHPLAER